MKKFSLVIIISATLMLICRAAFAHPSDGWQPSELDPDYGKPSYGWGADYNWNDFTFVSPLPDPASLTSQEKYMLAGTTHCGLGTGNGLLPWISQIIGIAQLCYTRNGYIPEQLTAEEFAKAAKTEAILIDPSVLDIVKSPITGEFPVLNARNFSAGNMYIQALSPEEISHFAQVYPQLKDVVENGRRWDAATGQYESSQITGPVLYVRVYGQSQVIYSNVVFSVTQ